MREPERSDFGRASRTQRFPEAVRIGIDASNLRAGGGITYLKGLLGALSTAPPELAEVILWGGRSTLDQLPQHPRLRMVPLPHLDGKLFRRDRKVLTRFFWQWTGLPAAVREAGCQLLYQPGGTLTRTDRRVRTVTISRNMLPFDAREIRRYGISPELVRLLVLRAWQLSSFRRAHGVIFLTSYAQAAIEPLLNPSPCRRVRVIPHGIGRDFHPPRSPRPQEGPSDGAFRWVYVSTVDAYKHHGSVVEAVRLLRHAGHLSTVDFWGHHRDSELRKLRDLIARVDPGQRYVRWRGPVDYSYLPRLLRSYDGFVFASSCENLPHTLLEAMATGLPIACSRAGPMPQVLGEGGLYFNPERPGEIACAMARIESDTMLRTGISDAALTRSRDFTWDRTGVETWRFLLEVAAISAGGDAA